MATTVDTISTMTSSEALNHLASTLDLTNIRLKLADPEEGKGYEVDHLNLMEQEYRRFLALHLIHPEADIVPCAMVDEMWHAHILDTAAYRVDCDRIFGHFLDHFPYFGMRGEQDAQDLMDAYDQTLQHYHEAFGEPADGTWRGVDPVSKCKRTNCKPQKCR